MSLSMALLTVATMLWMLYELLSITIDKRSETLDLIVRLSSLRKRKNRLYLCKMQNCKKLYRRWQMNLNEVDGDSLTCPHCGDTKTFKSQRTPLYREVVKEYHEGFDSHPDCPKVNWWNHMKIKNVAKQLRKNEKQMELDKFFQEYDKIEIDLSWIENLKKNRER